MFHVFSLVCFLIYGVNRRQVKWKGVKSEKIKWFPLVCSKYLFSWTGLGKSVNFLSTFRRDIWTNLARFGSRNGILTKWHNDSASFLPEMLKRIQKIPKNQKNTKINSEKIKAKTCFADKDLSSWTGKRGLDMTEVRVLVQLSTFRVQKWYFDEMT